MENFKIFCRDFVNGSIINYTLVVTYFTIKLNVPKQTKKVEDNLPEFESVTFSSHCQHYFLLKSFGIIIIIIIITTIITITTTIITVINSNARLTNYQRI